MGWSAQGLGAGHVDTFTIQKARRNWTGLEVSFRRGDVPSPLRMLTSSASYLRPLNYSSLPYANEIQCFIATTFHFKDQEEIFLVKGVLSRVLKENLQTWYLDMFLTFSCFLTFNPLRVLYSVVHI